MYTRRGRQIRGNKKGVIGIERLTGFQQWSKSVSKIVAIDHHQIIATARANMKDRVRVEVEPAEELSLRGGEIAMAAMVRVSCPAPEQNEHLPYRIEMMSQAAGLE